MRLMVILPIRWSFMTVTLIALILSSADVKSITLDDLKSSADFRVKVMLEPSDNIVVTQEVSLIIDIATTGWFAHGTAFDLPELKGAIVNQREQFATNSTLKEGRKAWASQRWELSVFPITEGRLTIPQIGLFVNVSVPGKGIVKGRVSTPEITIDATVPPEMKAVDNWLATPALSVEQEFDKALDKLKVGDALKQTITFKGEQLLAMMLPAYKVIKAEGLASYPKQPQLRDINTRGTKLAERIEVIDYIVEEDGEFQLPGKTFYFWNTDTNSREKITLAPTYFIVGEGVVREGPESDMADDASIIRDAFDWKILLSGLAAICLVYLFFYLCRKMSTVRTSNKTLTLHQINRKIRQACKSDDSKQLTYWLYIWMDQCRVQNEVYNDNQDYLKLREFIVAQNNPKLTEQVESVLRSAYLTKESLGGEVLKVPQIGIGFKHKLKELSFKTFKLDLEP